MSTLTARTSITVSDAEAKQAQHVGQERSPHEPVTWVVERGDERVQVPAELSAVISQVVETIARGGVVTVGRMPEELTTTVAARELGISRTTLLKMVAAGELPAHKVGSHTRVRSADVLAAKRARLARQRKALEELIELEDAMEREI
ncbi:helix-turn-helix domain-containing protein [Myceligenerans halotolerans]